MMPIQLFQSPSSVESEIMFYMTTRNVMTNSRTGYVRPKFIVWILKHTIPSSNKTITRKWYSSYSLQGCIAKMQRNMLFRPEK